MASKMKYRQGIEVWGLDIRSNNGGTVIDSNFLATIQHANTANRIYTLPDFAGTVILDAGAQTISGAKTFSNITTISNNTASISTITGALVVAGGVGIGGDVYATTFNGSGAGLTSIPNTALTNSSVTIGSTAVSLGGTVTSFAGLNTLSFTSSGGVRGIQFDYGSLGSLYSSAATMLGSNVYINPSDAVANQVRIKNTHASYGYSFYKQVSGVHAWYGASGSVTADAIVSPTYQMTLGSAGLTVYGSIIKNGGTSAQFLKADGSVDATTYVASGGALGTPTSGNLANCTFPTLNQSTTGSAATLTTPRTIALSTGVTGTATSFDGSANIIIPVTAVAANYLSGTIPASVLGNSTVYIGSTAVPLNRATGSLTLTGIASIDGSSASCTGNAATATKLAASKTIALSGDVTGTATAFDGSANITLTTTLSDTGVTDALLTNYVVGTNTALAATNSILTAFQNTQAQINAKLNATAQAADSAKLGGTAAASYALTSAIPVASSATPAMDGTGAAGTGTAWAKGDHVHPTDTSRAAVGQTFYLGSTQLTINRATGSQALTGITSIDGSAATLTTARAINGVDFNGSAAVTIPVNSTNDNATTTTCYPLWTTAAGNVAAAISASTFTWVPSTGTLGITTLQATGNVTAYYSSDRRLKENIKPIEHPLEKLQAINGVSFDWTEDYIRQQGGEDGYFVRKHDVGVIAQELQTVLPELVGERQDGYLGVRYDKIVALLIEAVKEQQVEIDALKARLEERK